MEILRIKYKCIRKASLEYIAAEKILYFFGEQGKLHGNTAQPKKFYIFSVTREASVALPRKRKCIFADYGSLVA
ncbi:hypothetical protein CQJ30_10490 [Caldibacillus thermoamylovorans]|nr:hypothetical protein CQJ30_10380 [Caldibacillus thermoamylovorans]AWI12547.1 hypothetical protein CQJ30_10490 [Caldibacillus thermoamylovorans]